MRGERCGCGYGAGGALRTEVRAPVAAEVNRWAVNDVKSPPKMQNDNRSNEDQDQLQGDQRCQVLPRGSPPARRPHGALGAGVCGQQMPPNDLWPDSRSGIRPSHRRQRRRRTEPVGRRSRLPRPVRSERGGAWQAQRPPAPAPRHAPPAFMLAGLSYGGYD